VALSAGDLATVRMWVGDGDVIATAALDAVFERRGNIWDTALEVLRTRRASIAARPKSWAAQGDLSEDWTGSLAAISETISEVLAAQAEAAGEDAEPVPGAPVLVPVPLVRDDRERAFGF